MRQPKPERVKDMARLIDADALYESIKASAQSAKEWREEANDEEIKIRAESAYFTFCECALRIKNAPTVTAEPKRGRWIECDWKHLEHGMLETDPNAGLCCSNCRTAFQKKKMTYKQYCAACGARMDEQDGGAKNG